jgi:hypothetical protein
MSTNPKVTEIVEWAERKAAERRASGDQISADGDGAVLLDDVRHFVARFVAFPSPAALDAVTLWAAHAHLVAVGENTPRLALLSPEPGSGKTRTLEVLELLCPAPMFALSASTPATFRSLAKGQRTLLFDEVDAIFGRHGKDDPAEDLRALLNAGHRKGATVPRCVGPAHDVADFPVFAATALAGLGDLPDTLMSRSVIIRMRKRLPIERIEQFRRRMHLPTGTELRDRLAAWCAEHAEEVGEAWPDMPDGVTDRPADCWEPLLAVADAAGGHWPEIARVACSEMVKVGESREASLGVKLLGDLRSVFADADVLSTEAILGGLHALEESPWHDLRGKPLDARGLARRLRQYEIVSLKVKADGKALQGYRREHLWDAWSRYLPPNPDSPEPPEPAEPGRSEATSEVPYDDAVPEPAEPVGSGDVPEVPEPRTPPEPIPPTLTRDVPEVPEVPLPGGSECQAAPLVPTADAPCPICQAPPPRLGSFGVIACPHQIAAGLVP